MWSCTEVLQALSVMCLCLMKVWWMSLLHKALLDRSVQDSQMFWAHMFAFTLFPTLKTTTVFWVNTLLCIFMICPLTIWAFLTFIWYVLQVGLCGQCRSVATWSCPNTHIPLVQMQSRWWFSHWLVRTWSRKKWTFFIRFSREMQQVPKKEVYKGLQHLALN